MAEQTVRGTDGRWLPVDEDGKWTGPLLVLPTKVSLEELHATSQSPDFICKKKRHLTFSSSGS